MSDKVKTDNKLGRESGAWVKNRFPDWALEPLEKVVTKARDFHAAVTLPFDAGLAKERELASMLEAPAYVPMDQQLARWAIDGAILKGRIGETAPPAADHWLMEYYKIGQQLAKLGETSAWDNVTPVATVVPPTSFDAVNTLTIGDAFKQVGGWMNGGELGYPSFGSMDALRVYTQRMVRAVLNAAAEAPTGGQNRYGAADWKEAYLNMKAFAESKGLDTATYGDRGAPVSPTTAPSDAAKFERLFMAACDDLAAVSDMLGLDSDIEGGAAPIIEAIESLRASAPMPSRFDLEAIDRAMQHMGDELNTSDSAEAEDENITLPGFEAIARLLEAAEATTVRIPTSADEAQLMANLGLAFLKDHAPERLASQLKAGRAADSAAERDAAGRYEFVRTLHPHEFANLWRENIAGRGTFDDLVDRDRAAQDALRTNAKKGAEP